MSTQPQAPEPILSTAQQRLLVAFAVLMLLCIALPAGYQWWRGSQPVHVSRLAGQEYLFTIDINQAGWIEWMQVPEIGEKLARQIVADREQHGPFATVDELTRVKGIGQKTLEKMRPHLRCPQP